MMKTITRIAVTVALAVFCLVQAGLAQDKKPMTFKGKVTAIDTAAGKLTVDSPKLEGWMDAMVMAYSVDNPAVLKTLKIGDQIEATVYEGDMVLHKVKAVKPSK